MAKRVTQEDIIQINELYIKLKTKAAVARETGFSASTVSKYIIPNYKPAAELQQKKFTGDLPDFNIEMFAIENWTPLLSVTDEEFEEIKELWEEIAL